MFSSKIMNFHFAFSILGLAVMLVLFVATPVYSQTFTVTGRVNSIDTAARTLTIEPTSYGTAGARGALTLALDANALVTVGEEKKNFSDIRVGDQITVNYHRDSNGDNTADTIAITSPSTFPFSEERG